jgi:hypothetical protein
MIDKRKETNMAISADKIELGERNESEIKGFRLPFLQSFFYRKTPDEATEYSTIPAMWIRRPSKKGYWRISLSAHSRCGHFYENHEERLQH